MRIFRLPTPPEAQFLQATPDELRDYCKAMQAWANELVRSLELNLGEITQQAGVGWTVTNPTQNRTLDSAADALGTVRNQLGTLVSDLKQRSFIG